MRQHGGRGGGAVRVKQGRGAYASPAYASVLCGALRVRMEGATYPGRTEHPRGPALAQRFSRYAEDVFSAAGRRADADPRGAAVAGDAAGIALERPAVEGALSRYTAQGVADSTRRSYASGLRRFERFCEQLGLQGLPASERVLSLFCAALAREGLRYATIKSYLRSRHLCHCLFSC